MNPFKMFLPNKGRNNNNLKRQSKEKSEKSFENALTIDDNFSNLYIDPTKLDNYLGNA